MKNKNKVFTTLGASNHVPEKRADNDYYATPPYAIDVLIQGGAKISKHVLEPACGDGRLSKKLEEIGHDVTSMDLIDRGYGTGGVDFLTYDKKFNGDIVTNPPYDKALEFVEHSLEIIPDGNKVFMFLKLTFLEGQKRRRLFDRKCLKCVYVSRSRIACLKNGEDMKNASSAVAYAWFEFEKGWYGDPVIKWIN